MKPMDHITRIYRTYRGFAACEKNFDVRSAIRSDERKLRD